MTSAVCPPRSPFTVTGRSPRFWSRPLGPPVRYLRPFTYAIFNTSSMASCLWVRLWLRVLRSGNPHLFLICSGGGGGPTWSWSLLLRGFVTVSGLVVGPAQPVPIQCRGYSLSLSSFISVSFYLFIRFLFILFMYLLCPCITGSPGGFCITDTRRDE